MNTQTFQKVISWIFHPLLAPIVACLMIFQTGHYLQFVQPELLKAIFVVVSAISLLLPLLLIPLFYFQGTFPDFSFKKRKHRLLLLTIVLITYSTGVFLMNVYRFPPIITHMFLAYTIGVFVVLIMQFIAKISMHTAAWGAILGLCLYLSMSFLLDLRIMFAVIILISGVVATSRMKIRKREPIEIYSAFLIGFTCMFCGMVLLNQ